MAIKESTSRHSDEGKADIDAQQKLKDHERAKVYVAAAREFMKHDPRWNMPRDTLRRLRMYRGDDEDLWGEYDWFYGEYEPNYNPQTETTRDQHPFDDDLKEFVLFHWNDVNAGAPINSYAEEMYNNGRYTSTATREDVRRFISSLSGRRPPVKDTPSGPRENRSKSFDPNRFALLTGREPE